MSNNDYDGLCKSPSVSELRHQRLYKSSTPPWKETYRKRCREQLQNNRYKFIERLRNCVSEDDITASVQDVMTTKLNELKEISKSRSGDETNIPETEDIDDILMMFEEISAELISEEQEILAQHRVMEDFDEQSLCASVMDNLQANEVLCPICQKNPLTVRLGVVHCPCGLRIDTEQDAITQEMIKTNLSHATEEHASCCNHRPLFNVFQQQAISNLLMSCQECDFLYIII